MASDVRSRLVIALEALHRPVMARQFPRLAGKMHGLEMSFSQLVAIAVVGNEGACTIADIAGKVDLTHNAASRMVDRLVEAGLFRRMEDPEDRRRKRVTLTDRGAEFMPEVQAASMETYEVLFAGVPDRLAERLLEALEEVSPYLPKDSSNNGP